MFFNGVIATSKPTVAPPKTAMIADSLELLPSQMAAPADRTVFYEFRGLFHKLSSPQSDFRSAIQGKQLGFTPQGIADNAELFSNENNRNLSITFSLSPEPGENADFLADAVTCLHLEIPRDHTSYKVKNFATSSTSLSIDSGYGLQEVNNEWYLTRGQERVAHFTPFFSALKPIGQTVYLGAFRNAINIGGNDNYFDIQVGEQFLRRWRQVKSGPNRQQARMAYRLTDDIRHIFGFDNLEINTSDDAKSLQVFVDGRPFRLDELGSGLAQFILVLASLASRQQEYILLDEPELNLHPSLQIDFLTTIASYATKGVLFGTHSIGLARAVGQQINALKRLREGVSEMRPLEGMPRLSEFLGELNFSGYRELGFQKVLLVEGPTDVITMQQFLRKRNLDHKIVVIPLGGSALINGDREAELSEMTRIANTIHVLIDSERTVQGEKLASNREEFIASCEKLGIQHHVLKRRATENYLTERAIKAVKGDAYRALGPFERLKDVSPAWGKQENWRIAREMSLEELRGTDLGEFIQSL